MDTSTHRVAVIEQDQRRMRRECLTQRICHILRDTVQLRGVRPETSIEDVRVDFTDASVRVLAPLLEAVDILEAIIWASDGCMGHRHCAHSMEPWQRARQLLAGKWEAESDPDLIWPDPESGRSLNAS